MEIENGLYKEPIGSIQVRKLDVIWGYLAQIFSLASGVIILPMVLSTLSVEEVGLNYIMLSIGALVVMIDFGFSPQFARNITYVFSGVNRLLKTGVERMENPACGIVINYHLLAALIGTARWIYRLMSGIVLMVMLTGGTLYVYNVTNGFSTIQHSLYIWLIYSLGIYFQIYFSYYNALLTGSGKMMESKKAAVYSNILKIVLTYLFLLLGFGLLGVVIANFVYPFLTRYLSYHYFFTSALIDKLSSYSIQLKEKVELFKILWYNSKKMGVTAVSGYLTYGATTFWAGLFLPLNEVAAYGLMTQLVSILSGIAGIQFTIYQPRLASIKVTGDESLFRKEVSYTMFVFYLLFAIGLLGLLYVAPFLLDCIGSETVLPATSIVLVCALFRFLDINFWNLCQTVISGNEFPFLKCCLFTGIGICAVSYVSLAYFNLSIWGLVLATGLVQLIYNDWYWPHKILKDLHTNIFGFLKEGSFELYNKVKLCIK